MVFDKAKFPKRTSKGVQKENQLRVGERNQANNILETAAEEELLYH